MTSVWPALWPPWKRTTMSACSDSQSTILPFPSSPHWAPTTTTLAIALKIPLQLSWVEHDLRTNPGFVAKEEGRPHPSGSCAQPKYGQGRSHARHHIG